MPLLAITEKITAEKLPYRIFFIGSKKSLDQEIIEKKLFSFYAIHTGKLRRYFSVKTVKDLLNFFYGIGESLLFLKKNKINLVFSKGGYVALPVSLAAFFLRIPVITHESDLIPGLTNKIIAAFANKILYSFPGTYSNNKKYLFTGTPIRSEIYNSSANQGEEFLNFSQKKPIVLFLGGSQGALQLNTLCQNIFLKIKEFANVVLIAGKGKKIKIKDASFQEFEFLKEEFSDVLATSTIVISRAGANSLFELAALKKASIIIPLASAAQDHQNKNAEFFAKNEAIHLINSNSSSNELTTQVKNKIIEWIEFPEKRKQFEKNIAKLDAPQASSNIIKQF